MLGFSLATPNRVPSCGRDSGPRELLVMPPRARSAELRELPTRREAKPRPEPEEEAQRGELAMHAMGKRQGRNWIHRTVDRQIFFAPFPAQGKGSFPERPHGMQGHFVCTFENNLSGALSHHACPHKSQKEKGKACGGLHLQTNRLHSYFAEHGINESRNPHGAQAKVRLSTVFFRGDAGKPSAFA